jgi:hypothetical protein
MSLPGGPPLLGQRIEEPRAMSPFASSIFDFLLGSDGDDSVGAGFTGRAFGAADLRIEREDR